LFRQLEISLGTLAVPLNGPPIRGRVAMHAAVGTTISILKLRIGSFIALATVVGIVAGGGNIGWIEGAVFSLAVLGASGAAGGFNQYFDRDIDRLMKRTQKRPFASGAIAAGAIWPVTFTA